MDERLPIEDYKYLMRFPDIMRQRPKTLLGAIPKSQAQKIKAGRFELVDHIQLRVISLIKQIKEF